MYAPPDEPIPREPPRRRTLRAARRLAVMLLAIAAAGCGRHDAADTTRPAVDTEAGRRAPAAGSERVCDMRFAGIRLVVRTADGQPVNDARVEVRRESDSALVRTLTASIDGQGGYVVLDDAEPGAVTPPVAYMVSASRGALRASARLVAGADASGCHVSLLSGPAELVVR